MRHPNPFYLFLTLVLLTACATPRQMALFQPDDASQYTLPEPPQTFIEPHDNITLRISAVDPEVLAPYRDFGSDFYVNADGTILLPIIGNISVAGLTEQQAADTIALRLSSGVVNPYVQLVDQSLYVIILGEVGAPGRYGLRSTATLPNLIGLAGGLTPNARRDDVLILRREGSAVVRYHVSLSDNSIFSSPCYWLQRGDVIILSPRYSHRVR